MNIALMVITDGRWDYLQQTLESAAQCLDYPFSQRLLVDDSGESVGFVPDGFDIIRNLPRKGLAGAIQTGWDHLNDDIDFVFHLEDDFVFPDEVDIELMVEILEYEPELARLLCFASPGRRRNGRPAVSTQSNPSASNKNTDSSSRHISSLSTLASTLSRSRNTKPTSRLN